MTSSRRRVLTWVGATCLLTTPVVAFAWTIHPSSTPEPSTLLPATPLRSSEAVPRDLQTHPTLSSISVSPSSLQPPARPPSATGTTAVAAADFVGVYFTEAINHAKTTGDVSMIRARSDISCKLCSHNMAVFARSNQANGLLTGDHRWRDAQVSQVHLSDPTTATVDLSISIGRHTYAPRHGAPPTSLPAQTIDLHITLVAVGGNWLMFDWERLH